MDGEEVIPNQSTTSRTTDNNLTHLEDLAPDCVGDDEAEHDADEGDDGALAEEVAGRVQQQEDVVNHGVVSTGKDSLFL